MTITQFNFSRILTALALSLALTASVQAALEVREEALELKSEQVRWPLRTGDSFVVRPCAACDNIILQVTEQTRYAIGFGRNSEITTLDELLRQKSLLHDKENHLLVIFFLPNTRQVTRVILQTEF